MTSMGMNWLQKGRTLSSAPKAWYFASTSGRACPFTLQRGNLNTGTPSFSASKPVGQRVRNWPLLDPPTHGHLCLPSKVTPTPSLQACPSHPSPLLNKAPLGSTEGTALTKGEVSVLSGLTSTDHQDVCVPPSPRLLPDLPQLTS